MEVAEEEVQIEVSMSKSGEGEVIVNSPSSSSQQKQPKGHDSPPPAATAKNVEMGIDKSDSMLMQEQKEEEDKLVKDESVEMDLSALRGIAPPSEPDDHQHQNQHQNGHESGKQGEHTANNNQGQNKQQRRLGFGSSGGGESNDKNNKKNADLEGLAELVPGLKHGEIESDAVATPQPPFNHDNDQNNTRVVDGGHNRNDDEDDDDAAKRIIPHIDSMAVNVNVNVNHEGENKMAQDNLNDDYSEENDDYDGDDNDNGPQTTNALINSYTAKPTVREIGEESESSDDSKSTAAKTHSSHGEREKNHNTNIDNNNYYTSTPPRQAQDESMYGATPTPTDHNLYHLPHQSSAASISTATHTLQTADMSRTGGNNLAHILYLPTFRPATGCTNCSDFIVRCFVARLRSGITVVKHGRSRWCKSRLRILHVHSDGRSLSWKPADGEPKSSNRPPKLDLSTCLEVRHAWTPDPNNPSFTGTQNLRSKCDASNAFKSFALIFPKRTVDITAVTADQCKVLMEGFSALCYRLQVANMATARSSGTGAGVVGNRSSGGNNDEGDVI